MSPIDAQPKVVEVLHAVAEFKAAPAPDESLFDSGLLDSFTLNDLVLELEKTFSITIPDGDISARRFDTLDKIAQYVAAKAK